MEPLLRKIFNDSFSIEKYNYFLEQIDAIAHGQLDFRVAETPIFVPKVFKKKMLETCEDIIDFITDPDFKSITERSIPETFRIPSEDSKPQMMVFDFGICKNKNNELEPQLIEMQGFPSLYAYQILNDELSRKYAAVPHTYDSFLNNYNATTYKNILEEIILGEHENENVIILEIYPDKQKTRIDFIATEKLLNIETVCITQLKAINQKLYYEKNETLIEIKRIFNRIVFDELKEFNLQDIVDLTQPLDVEWAPHPNWFYRISKFTLPFLSHPFIPETFFLNEIKTALPLNEYVLKPLFSFAGTGVVIDVTQEHIDKINDPENWILQRKVNYAPIIETPDEPAKAEIRLFYFWKKEWKRPIAIHNLARLSKGAMIGTRYNQDKTWVGGTIAFFEKD